MKTYRKGIGKYIQSATATPTASTSALTAGYVKYGLLISSY